MEDSVIAIYCFIDDLCKKMFPSEQHFNRKLTDSQVISTLVVAALFFYGNQATACSYMKTHHQFKMPDKSNFNRRAHELEELLADIFFVLSKIIKELNLESVYIIDSFPVAVCKNIRISRSKLVKGKEFRGYNASKREYFYGFKVQLITTGTGIPVEVLITPGSRSDNAAMQAMDIDLPCDSDLYADAAYFNQLFKELLQQHNQITLNAETKKNFKEQNTWIKSLEIKYFRKQIETSFSSINRLLPKKIHAVTAKGFILKLFIFVLAFTINGLF
jgi:hypothetical protein